MMNDDKDKKAPEDSEERTVFMPSAGEPAAPADPEPAPTPAEPAAGTPETATDAPAADPAPEPAADPAPAAPETPAPSTTSGTQASFTPTESARQIKVGDVLNHIFEVKRFLARGGMGEVFEGTNVNTDERVAIKVMLPAMAADEKVVAMFRKEARTLTKLQHEALVSYRVLAQEPNLGVLYIVTEFIEGTELADVLGKVERTPDELKGLLRRLASGLGAAHKLGAIHRDMSPDNVLLPGGDVHQAKIIDFGIAKDLDSSSATIVGDGFAGKLNYVAPEQLGDYGREVGPWTDVYSLALVILAVAQGKNVNMSGSLVDAIDKRRKGPDIAAVPDGLKPIIEAMLRPDPKDRLRSMDEVLAMLGGAAAPPPPPTPTATVEAPAAGGGSKVLIVIGVLVLAALAGLGAWWFMGRPTPAPAPVNGNNNTVAVSRDPVETARGAINSVLPSVNCTWLEIGAASAAGDGVSIAMRGVAGDEAAAQREIARALTEAHVENARLDFSDVAPITPAGCSALDTYRQIRATEATHLSVPQTRFPMRMLPADANSAYAGQMAATPSIAFDFGNSNTDFVIVGLEPSGTITTLIPSRAQFEATVAQSVGGRPIANDGNGRYRLNIDLNHQGWSGILLLTGQGPFDPNLVAPPLGARGPAWTQAFVGAASQQGWRAEMVWFQSVEGGSGQGGSGGASAPAEGGK
jgi:serine/threonine-protein kinase